jgi:hypothetical protein
MRGRTLILTSLLFGIVNATGCGGSSHPPVNPEAMLDSAAAHPIKSGQTEIDLRIEARGVSQLPGPVRLRLDGPYVSGGGTQIPSFDWKLTASALGFPVGGQVVSTGTNAYLSVYGDNYEIGTAAVAAANQRIQQATAAGQGIHPRSWFGRAHIDGDGNEGGVDCERISARLRGDAMARDLTPWAVELGLSGPPAVSGTARACVGFDDRVLHELTVDAEVSIPPADRARLGGATSIHLEADVTNSDVGQPQRISIPAGGGYRPIRDLALTLNDLGVRIPLG